MSFDQEFKFTDQEERMISILDDRLQKKSVRAKIETIAKRVELKLLEDSSSHLAWEPVPLETYKMKLPEMIRSSWVFAVRSRANTGAERHPNSHQFMMSYKRSGDLQIRIDDNWMSNPLISVLSHPIENRWVSIPPNVWHRAISFEKNWIVVSFHTASAKELIEERPDPDVEKRFRQRYYMEWDFINSKKTSETNVDPVFVKTFDMIECLRSLPLWMGFFLLLSRRDFP